MVSMSYCMETLSRPSSVDAPCLIFLMLLDGSEHYCEWDLVLSGPTVGIKCSGRLTQSPFTSEAGGGSSYFWWFLFFLQVIENGFVEIEGALPVDCTPTIKSVLG